MSMPTSEMTRDYVPVAQEVPFEKGLTTYVASELDPTLFAILGTEFSEIVEIHVPPQSTISAEPGTLIHMDPRFKVNVDMGGCGQGCRRCCCAGESCCRLNFFNRSTDVPQVLALSGRIPSKIVPVHLGKYPHGIFVRAGGFLAAVGKDWAIELKLTGCCTGCCGGMGFVLNKYTGSGWVFLGAGGTVMQKLLQPGESFLCDQSSIMAFESTVKFSVEAVGGPGVMCCGGMGFMNARLTGPGFVLLESMSPTKLTMGLRRG